MKCPFCSSDNDKVVDTRLSEDGLLIRRRRECLNCSQRFTTKETVELRPLKVVKAGGRIKEEFSREKLKGGIMKAIHKRPVDDEEIEMMIDDVFSTIRYSHEKEVESGEIGNLVMDRLKQLDKVAYIRFASVYRDFRDVEEFLQELKDVITKKGRRKRDG